MSKRKHRTQQIHPTQRAAGRVLVVVVGLMISLTLAAGGGSRGNLRAVISPDAGTEAEMSAAALAQSQQPPLAKEYVYAGSRLVATEEPSCSYSLSLSCALFANTGGQGAVDVTAGAGCSWTAASNANWLTISSNPGGAGNGVVAYVARDNFSGVARQATITIAGLSFTVLQDGTSNCSYTISTTNASFGPSGGTGGVSVTAASGCAWQAVPDVNWVRITSSPCGMSNATVTYTVEPNLTGVGRNATIRIGNQVLAIKQKAA
jgi:hypothetical protein